MFPDCQVFSFGSPPTAAVWRQTLESVGRFASQLGLIVARDELDPSARAGLEALAGDLVSEEAVTGWPNSQLVGEGDFALRYSYRWTAAVQAVLAAAPPSSWINPHLPEDPHLLRVDGTVLLGTTAGHDYVWLNLTATELEVLHSDAAATRWLDLLAEEPSGVASGLATLIRSYLDDDDISLTPKDSQAEVVRNTWSFGHEAGADDDPGEVAAALLDTAAGVHHKLYGTAVPYAFYAWYDDQSGYLKCSLTSQPVLPFGSAFIEVDDPAVIAERAVADLSPGRIPLNEFTSVSLDEDWTTPELNDADRRGPFPVGGSLDRPVPLDPEPPPRGPAPRHPKKGDPLWAFAWVDRPG